MTWQDEIFYITDNNNKTIAFDPAPHYGVSDGQLIFLANGEVHYLIYLPTTYARSDSIFFFILDISEITFRLKNLVSEEIPGIALIDGDGQFITGINTEKLTPYMASIQLKDGIYEEDTTTSICVRSDIKNGYWVVSVLSNDFLLDQVNDAFASAYLSLLLLSAMGLLMILMVMRITYLPLHRLTQKVVFNPDSRQSYLNQLDEAFSKVAQQKELLQEKLSNYRLSIQKSLLDSMLAPASDSPHNLAESSPAPSTDILPNIDQFFDNTSEKLIFVVKVSSYAKTLPKTDILEYFADALPGKDTCILLKTHEKENTAAYLLNYTGSAENKAQKLKELTDKLYTDCGFYSAISNGSDSPLDIPALYESATWASDSWPRIPVAEYQTLSQGAAEPSYTYPHDLLNRLADFLKELNFTAAREVTSELFEKLNHYAAVESTLPAFLVRSILIDILTIIVSQMNTHNINLKAYSNLYFEALYLCRSCSYNEESDAIIMHVEELLTFFEQNVTNKFINSTLIRQLMEEYYCQPDFSISMLADQFHVSITYMSTMFKKELNMNFSDYLWMLRLNKAKELLCTTDMSINEISIAVGYLNTTSFQRKFKQETGMTPSQLRAVSL